MAASWILLTGCRFDSTNLNGQSVTKARDPERRRRHRHRLPRTKWQRLRPCFRDFLTSITNQTMNQQKHCGGEGVFFSPPVLSSVGSVMLPSLEGVSYLCVTYVYRTNLRSGSPYCVIPVLYLTFGCAFLYLFD